MDPREIITPEALTVAPELLGRPLARPRRRAVAMLVDLVVLAILIRFIDSIFLPLIAGVLFLRMARPVAARGLLRRTGTALLRVLAFVLIVVFAVKIYSGVSNFIAPDEDAVPDLPAPVAAELEARVMQRIGVAPAAVDTTRLNQLQLAVTALQQQNLELRGLLEEARERRGLRRVIASFADDLGLGFGWFALYFTAFLALWQGQTPGKRLLRMRVIRLDGRPMSWWLAFERFGGYAASFSTGLLGFAQMLWDRNRQGLHDKAAGTVVVQLPH